MSNRLREIADALGPKPPESTDGRGHRMWQTRRANKFAAAVGTLVRQDKTLDELRLAAHEVSEQLAGSHAGEVLPRGYFFQFNCHGERSLSHGETLFAPGLRDTLPGAEAIAQFGRDLKTGWLVELERL